MIQQTLSGSSSSNLDPKLQAEPTNTLSKRKTKTNPKVSPATENESWILVKLVLLKFTLHWYRASNAVQLIGFGWRSLADDLNPYWSILNFSWQIVQGHHLRNIVISIHVASARDPVTGIVGYLLWYRSPNFLLQLLLLWLCFWPWTHTMGHNLSLSCGVDW
jgi:hypothetical protein